jgi:hypothetical protein
MMSETGEIEGWRQMSEFTDVDLSRSFALSWHVESDVLFIDIDLCLAPEHPFYEKPRPAEKVCIRPAYIEFPFCGTLVVNGETDGQLAGLRRLSDTRYEISGEFGTVLLDAEAPLLRLK